MGLKVDNLKNTLKKEQKKVAFLVALAAVFLYVWIPLMKGSDPVPNPAAANLNPKATAKSRTGKAGREATPPVTEKERKVTYPAFLKKPLPAVMLPRNPFLSLADETPPEPEPVAVEETNTEEEALKATEKARAEKMVITSTMLSGRNPSCVVDGLVLVKGSEYNGFKVKKISEFGVVIVGEYGAYQVTIRKV